MITFFACPKPFQGHIDIIQRNAIESWTLLRPKPEILLLGIEDGISQVCKELGLIHIAEIDRNEYGTPLVNSIFQIAQERASYPNVCYINSDIILMSEFMQAFKTVAARMPKFLILGQRWDLDLKEALRFASSDWETDLKTFMSRKAKIHAPTGIDFFCFPKGTYTDIPPFAIGRYAWDNWLVWRAWSKGVPLIDITEAAAVIHQNHEHAIGTIRSPDIQEVDTENNGDASNKIKKIKIDGRWVEVGPEAKGNIAFVPDTKNLNIWAATRMLKKNGKIERRRLGLSSSYLYYHLKCMVPLYSPIFGRLIRWISAVRSFLLSSNKY